MVCGLFICVVSVRIAAFVTGEHCWPDGVSDCFADYAAEEEVALCAGDGGGDVFAVLEDHLQAPDTFERLQEE
ncbi:hypothetical protein BJY04DRAFT_187603 [Aspergillus karnatakaensis]|uniref:uncharacterized protein n=1 Tax=Aspergillus karnatakaensis TaxID=1810916 RepID=UPI003CCDA08E